MALADRRILKERAADTLAANENAARRTVLIYSGALAGLQFAVALVNILLGNLTDRLTQGVSGLAVLDTVAMLETVQTVLDLLTMVLPTFWLLGYLYVLQRMTLGQELHDGMLLQGFRNFGPVLRKLLLEGLLYSGVMMLGVTVGSTLVSFTPLATPMVEAVMQYENVAVLTEQQLMEIVDASIPALAVCLLIALALVVPLMYRLRMSNYVLMDYPKFGAIFAMTFSFRMTKGSVWRLLKLELSFLWYYIPVVAASLITTLVTFLPPLPIDGEVLYLIALAVSLLIQVGLQYWASNKVEMTFVHAYRTLMADMELPKGQNRIEE